MRLIIREYLSLLKEDKELDLLMTEILSQMSIIPISKPSRGRQHGVDIAGVGIDPGDNIKKLYLLVVKRGDLTRSNWATGQNAVRPSLEEIFDTYLRSHVSAEHSNLPKKIIVCTNGELHQLVQSDWSGYTQTHSRAGEIEISFWGLEEITNLISAHLLNESLFPPEIQKLLRKALVLLDLPEYTIKHFYELIDKILADTPDANVKQRLKTMRVLNLSLTIFYHWAIDSDNIKPAFLASERVVLKAWDWLRKQNLLSASELLAEYIKILAVHRNIRIAYIKKMQTHCYVKDGLAFYGGVGNQVEYPLLVYEQLGILSSAGLTAIYEAELYSAHGNTSFAEVLHNEADVIGDMVANLIENNPGALYPQYDEHCIDICLTICFLYEVGRDKDARNWLNMLVQYIDVSFNLSKFFPLFYTDYEELVEIRTTGKAKPVTSSMLLTCLAEWSIILKSKGMYSYIYDMIQNNFSAINLQLWYPEEDTDEILYTQNAIHESGTTQHSIRLPKNYKEHEMVMAEELKLFNKEYKLSSFQHRFYFLPIIASRHYRTYVFPVYWRASLNTIFCFNGN